MNQVGCPMTGPQDTYPAAGERLQGKQDASPQGQRIPITLPQGPYPIPGQHRTPPHGQGYHTQGQHTEPHMAQGIDVTSSELPAHSRAGYQPPRLDLDRHYFAAEKVLVFSFRFITYNLIIIGITAAFQSREGISS